MQPSVSAVVVVFTIFFAVLLVLVILMWLQKVPFTRSDGVNNNTMSLDLGGGNGNTVWKHISATTTGADFETVDQLVTEDGKAYNIQMKITAVNRGTDGTEFWTVLQGVRNFKGVVCMITPISATRYGNIPLISAQMDPDGANNGVVLIKVQGVLEETINWFIEFNYTTF